MGLPLYDKTSPVSIFQYSAKLLGHSLRDLNLQTEDRTGKGRLGQLVEELFFNYKPNNFAGPDFEEAGVELKCTPLKYDKNQELIIKERLVCCMINYCEDFDKDFEDSHFYKKCLLMLILFYLHEKDAPSLDLKFLYSLLWKLPLKDLIIIKNDYETIISKIRSGNAHLLSEGDTMYLGACRKGHKGESLEKQPFNEVGAPRRAWSLKTSYMRTLLQYIKDSKQTAISNITKITPVEVELVSYKQLRKHTFDEVLLERFKPYYGKSCNQIFKKFGKEASRAKSRYAMAANAVASNMTCSNINLSEEFQKAGLIMKTIRVEMNGSLHESMSFENIDYQEVYQCDNWFDSRLYEIFSNRFLFVVFEATGKKMRIPSNESNKKYELTDEYVLKKVFFWTMPQKDLLVAEKYWNDIRSHIFSDNIKVGTFWREEDKNNFHVRPKGQLAKFKDISPVTGNRDADQLCYWFNKDYVKQIIKDS